jgi:Ca-activated chloride channel family protein
VKAFSFVLAVVLSVSPMWAQTQAPTVFRSGTDLVSLSVVVTDPQQRYVTGLSASDFEVFEDGVLQDLSFFSATAVPIDLAILLDTSSSMLDKMQTVQEAAVGFASHVRPGDRLAVVDIKDNVRVLHPLGEDVDGAREAIRKTVARGSTSLYNGIYMTLRDIVKQRRSNGEVRREAIVVLSDGDDTSSLVTFDDVMEVAKQTGVSIYTIALKSPYLVRRAQEMGERTFSESDFAMKSLAQQTGGRSFTPMAVTELAGVYGLIAKELASQYALGYSPKNQRADGAYRRVVVRVSQPNVQTRTRAGYTAPRAQQAVRVR